MKHTLKKIICIALLTVFFIAILLQNNVIAASSNEDNDRKYTIEDMVYNRVPVFDINVFSSTAGGEEVTEGSVVDTIRTVVATWYVAIRNIVAVLLGILLIYTGLRMAIATVASDKAKYKEFLLGWLKSIIILFTINYTMMIVLNLNDLLVNMFSGNNSTEVSMYETIRTRAYDFRFSVGMTGMIMYITLVIMLVRFTWLYVKRTFTVLILIIIAPIISAKYAFDSASGKKSLAFSEWLYQFCANVLIQAAHALLYTSVVGISLETSTENIVGFIIALMFLNFMLSADKIVFRIFKFDKQVEDLQKPFKKEENLAGVFYTYGAVKMAKRLLKSTSHKVKVLSYSPELRGVKNSTTNIRNNVSNSIDNAMLSVNSRVEQRLDENGKKGGLIDRKIQSMNKTLILRKASRRKGVAGSKARQVLKMRKDQRKAVFKSNYKFIKNDIKGIGGIVLAVPVMVLNPGAGVGMFATGVGSLKENGKAQRTREYSLLEKGANIVTFGQYINRTEQSNFNNKRNKKIDDTMKNMLEANETMDKIEKQVGKYDKKTKEEVKNAMKAHYMSNASRVNKYVMNYMSSVGNINMDIGNIDDATRNEMVDYVVGIIDRGCNIGETQKRNIENQVKSSLANNRYTANKNTNMMLFASTIQDAVRSNVTTNKFTSEIELVNELEEKNNNLYKAIYNATEDEATQAIDIENYIDTL